MKIALIAPPYPLEEIPSPPLGLTYIAAVGVKPPGPRSRQKSRPEKLEKK